MRNMLTKGLAALLIGALLLAPAGFAEEDIIAEVPAIVEESVEEPVEESVEEPVEEIPGEPVEEVAEAVVSEAVESAVEEAADVELSEDAELEPESVEEVLLESPEEVVTEEPAAQAEAPAQEAVAEESEAAAKVLAEGEELIPIDEAHFPDPAFRQYVAEKFDSNDPGNVGYLSQLERESVHTIGGNGGTYAFYTTTGNAKWVGLNITSIQGVEYFPNVQMIDCSHNPIVNLDVSMLKNLEQLICMDCGMTSLNVSGCSGLKGLNCYDNRLTTLDLSNCPNLIFLGLAKNSLTSLNLSGCSYFAGFPSGFKKFTKISKSRFDYMKKLSTPVQVPSGFFSMGYTPGTVAYLYCDRKLKINGSSGATNNPTGFTETPGVTVTVDPASTAKNTRATVVAAPGSAIQLSTDAGAKQFKSSNKKVAKVSKGGVVTFKKGGKVKITYKVGKKTRKVTLTVTDPTLPTAVAISEVNTAVKKGESVTLTPTVNEGANPGGYKWKTSNKKVATVKNGVVKFKKKGKVTITCTTKRGKKKARVTFAVSK